jgi:hypothetical protein
MSTLEDAKGPYVVWINNGCEGWQPTSFSSLYEALNSHKYSVEWVITKIVKYEIKEI